MLFVSKSQFAQSDGLCIFPEVAELAMNTLDTWTQSLLPADTLWPVVARAQPVLHGAPQVHILVQAWDSPHEGEAVISDIKTYQELYIKIYKGLSSAFINFHLSSFRFRTPQESRMHHAAMRCPLEVAWQEGDINCEEMYILLRHLYRGKGSWGAGSATSACQC